MSKKNNPKFTINNFRNFKKPNKFEIAPITILTGPNNSGKSSLVKAISLLNNNKINGRLKYFIDYNSKNSRLYGAENIFNDSKINLEFSFESTISVDSNIKNSLQTLFKYDVSFNPNGFLNHFSISHNNFELISFNYDNYITECYDVNFNLKLLMQIFNINKILYDLNFEDEFILTSEIKSIYSVLESEIIHDFNFNIRENSKNPVDGDFQNLSYLENEEHALLRFSTINEIVEDLIEKIFRYLKELIISKLNSKYFSNFNLIESKNYSIFKNKLIILIRGFDYYLSEYEFHELLINRNIKNRNIDLTDESQLLNKLVKRFYKHVDSSDPLYFEPWLNFWLEKFEIGKWIIIENFNGEIANIIIKDLNNEDRDLSACGTGVTQIITILLSCLLDPKIIETIDNKVFETNELNLEKEIYKNVFYLEEPESNLHPNWHSLLMELLVEMNLKFGFCFIIETHSEYMIRKLQFLMADNTKKLDTDNVLIYYFNSDKFVDESKGEPKVKKIKIDKNGGLSDNFGPGFYDEAINLKFDLLKLNKHQSN
jgi:AAA15 family ATPase/GTPase